MSNWTPPRLPADFPAGMSIHAQRDTETAGYVALVHYFVDGMRYASMVSRAYGDTEQQAWERAVAQVQSGERSLL